MVLVESEAQSTAAEVWCIKTPDKEIARVDRFDQ
jgi:hypothetical protein